MILLLKF